MGRRKKYRTAAALERKIDEYFLTITREKIVTEKVATGELDQYGHMTYRDEPVLNRLGNPLTIIEYIEPPTVAGLCEFLGIDRSTWANYCDEDQCPEFLDTTQRARGRLQAWLEREMLTRKGNDIKGIQFNLEANYGYSRKSVVEVGGGLERFLRETAEQGGAEF